MATMPVFDIIPPYTPELLPDVQMYLESHLKRTKQDGESLSVLELGSGYSTIWFAQQEFSVISLEHDRGWFEEVSRILYSDVPNNRVWIHLVSPEKFVDTIKRQEKQFDLILIDCVDELRIPSTRASLEKLKANGLLILDDSHWGELSVLALEYRSFKRAEFCGQHTRKTGEVKYHQTTIFQVP